MKTTQTSDQPMTPAQAVAILRQRFPSAEGWNVVIQGTFYSYARGEDWGFPVSEGYQYSISAFKSGTPGADVPHLCSTEFRQGRPDAREAESIAGAVEQFLTVFGEAWPIQAGHSLIGHEPLFATESTGAPDPRDPIAIEVYGKPFAELDETEQEGVEIEKSGREHDANLTQREGSLA